MTEELPVPEAAGANCVIVTGIGTDAVVTCASRATVVSAREFASLAVDVLLSATTSVADAVETVCIGAYFTDELSIESVTIAAAPCATVVASSLAVNTVPDPGLDTTDVRPRVAAAMVHEFNAAVNVLD